MQKTTIIAAIAGFCAGAAVAAVGLSLTDADERLAAKTQDFVDGQWRGYGNAPLRLLQCQSDVH